MQSGQLDIDTSAGTCDDVNTVGGRRLERQRQDGPRRQGHLHPALHHQGHRQEPRPARSHSEPSLLPATFCAAHLDYAVGRHVLRRAPRITETTASTTSRFDDAVRHRDADRRRDLRAAEQHRAAPTNQNKSAATLPAAAFTITQTLTPAHADRVMSTSCPAASSPWSAPSSSGAPPRGRRCRPGGPGGSSASSVGQIGRDDVHGDAPPAGVTVDRTAGLNSATTTVRPRRHLGAARTSEQRVTAPGRQATPSRRSRRRSAPACPAAATSVAGATPRPPAPTSASACASASSITAVCGHRHPQPHRRAAAVTGLDDPRVVTVSVAASTRQRTRRGPRAPGARQLPQRNSSNGLTLAGVARRGRPTSSPRHDTTQTGTLHRRRSTDGPSSATLPHGRRGNTTTFWRVQATNGRGTLGRASNTLRHRPQRQRQLQLHLPAVTP